MQSSLLKTPNANWLIHCCVYARKKYHDQQFKWQYLGLSHQYSLWLLRLAFPDKHRGTLPGTIPNQHFLNHLQHSIRPRQLIYHNHIGVHAQVRNSLPLFQDNSPIVTACGTSQRAMIRASARRRTELSCGSI